MSDELVSLRARAERGGVSWHGHEVLALLDREVLALLDRLEAAERAPWKASYEWMRGQRDKVQVSLEAVEWRLLAAQQALREAERFEVVADDGDVAVVVLAAHVEAALAAVGRVPAQEDKP